jgi:hypothetical protein
VVILRERPPAEPAQIQDVSVSAGQITYLIASKDNVVRLAAQYWVNGRTLFYLTASHQQKSMPIDSVDRTLSARLNREQNVTFSLPAAQEKTIVASHQIHSTTTSARKQCFCVSTHSTGKASRERFAARVSR